MGAGHSTQSSARAWALIGGKGRPGFLLFQAHWFPLSFCRESAGGTRSTLQALANVGRSALERSMSWTTAPAYEILRHVLLPQSQVKPPLLEVLPYRARLLVISRLRFPSLQGDMAERERRNGAAILIDRIGKSGVHNARLRREAPDPLLAQDDNGTTVSKLDKKKKTKVLEGGTLASWPVPPAH